MAKKKKKSQLLKNLNKNKTVKKIKKSKVFKQAEENKKFISIVLLILVLGIGSFYLAKRYRGLVVAAVVNKTPITRWKLNQTMTTRYGQPVLDELINNELLRQKAKQEGVTVSQEQVQEELDLLAERFGGADSLDIIREQYGLSQSDLEEQIRLRIIQEQLSDRLFDIQVTQEEVEQYYQDNASAFEDQELAEVEQQIRDNLLNQKLQQEFSAWFDKAKQEAQINTYIQQ